MPGARTRVRPLSASEPSTSDEALQLKLHLQKEFEDDVARIFDESIHSDIEVVCGKQKILTHSCILKARTKKFYHKLETLLYANLDRSTFDEINSFISDAYTECNIRNQEKEILAYLNEKLNIIPEANDIIKPEACTEEAEIFLTPKCITPYIDKDFPKSVSASPSTELTKEYYALVPLESNLLEQELKEQDVLSNAFQSIIKYQIEDLNKLKITQRTKPTSLSLSSSLSSKIVKHSKSCDISNKCYLKINTSNETESEKINGNKRLLFTSQQITTSNTLESTKNSDHISEKSVNHEVDNSYSPDSLITDDSSSSSDYHSAAHICSPGISSSVCLSQLNAGNYITKMDKNFTSSDSGLENTGLLESLGSHKDVTLIDVSLTESTLQDLTIDEANSDTLNPSHIEKNELSAQIGPSINTVLLSGSSSENDLCEQISYQPIKIEAVSCKSSKEEKQRQNEEIVILESSSLSSETGSWESVFPPKISEKEVCEKFIRVERAYCNEFDTKEKNEEASYFTEHYCPSVVKKSSIKPSSCFIDAASLVDEYDTTQNKSDSESKNVKLDILPTPSQPIPCTTARQDISPNDWSENEDEDSLEKADNKDPDSADLLPTVVEMTPITEDSLCTNAFASIPQTVRYKKIVEIEEFSNFMSDKEASPSSNAVFITSTPHNSIMSLKTSALKQYEESDCNTTVGREGNKNFNLVKCNETVRSPILSESAPNEDRSHQVGSLGSPLIRRKIENIPIISWSYTPKVEDNDHRKSPKRSCPSAWVVDMSSSPKSDGERSVSSTNSTNMKKSGDRICVGSKHSSFDNCNKSRSSVDSDSSEKSSHKFYIDLSTLPDSEPPKKNNDSENTIEKKNIFSMYIDLGDKTTLKEIPSRLSSLSTKKNTIADARNTPKSIKARDDRISCPEHGDSQSTMIFKKYESMCNDPTLNISEILTYQAKDKKNSTEIKNNLETETSHEKNSRGIGGERTYHQNSTVIHEESWNDSSGDLFVKLSDLDKTAHKAELSTKPEKTVVDVRMTRSIPDNNWGEQSNAATSRSIEVISSFHSENALSLNRLFPHLRNEFSRSMPGSLSARTRSPVRLGVSSSPGDVDEQASDMSEISSVQSSICRSVVENSTTEETSQTSSLIDNCQSRLGQDLLRMFLEEIAPDVIVDVSGRRIKAHKCILSSRCQYFAAMLSGGSVASAGGVIVFPDFSFNVVHFALCHIYSGVSTIPDSISIVELSTIAEMLGLEGLKEAIMFTLKVKYCHHFHRPCPVCTVGVLQCFPLSSIYGLDDLYQKCLKWITKYFSKVWPTKAFATLPKELLDKCYQQHIINLTTDNFVDTVYGCGITVASLQNSRWSESVARMCRRLVNAAAHFAAPRLGAVLRATTSLSAEAPHPAQQALDDCLAAAIEWAPPDEACRAYAFLSALIKEIRNQNYSKPDLVTNGNQGKVSNASNFMYNYASSWRLQCECALVRAAPRVVGTQAFKDLPTDLRKRLRELGCIMYGTKAVPTTSPSLQDRKTRSTSHKKSNKTHNALTTRSLDIDHVRSSFVPYASKPAATASSMDILKSNQDLRDKKLLKANLPKVRTTKAQEERAKYNLSKKNESQDILVNKHTPARATSFENTKPRYLTPRAPKEIEKKSPVTKKLVPKKISSSESSRNSSPIQARNMRTSKMRQASEAQGQIMSQDSLATTSRPRTAEPSTDSLSESQNSNKYATYTKAKHTAKGSIESVKSSRGPVYDQTPSKYLKTKIPVYMSPGIKAKTPDNKYVGELQNRSVQPARTYAGSSKPLYNTPCRDGIERKVPGSLMNATKSSSAKIVPRIVKNSSVKSTVKNPRRPTNHTSRHQEQEQMPEIHVMERSGTFLKDEPTFSDNTTDIDVDQ